ncbi:MAG TPA: site-2 protease family protein [Planctomycetota bacterium]|nr:site-2 protease family protein [Planctomycetota bacterium]
MLVTIAVFALFLYSVILHEIAHGWVALKCGDPTAKWEGRLTLNPVPHIDPWMSIILPLLMYMAGGVIFGGARPVPVNLYNLRRYPRDWILVAIAGIATNLAIAVLCSVLLHILAFGAPALLYGFLGQVLFRTAVTNLILVVFNLIPIPPLDGSRVFRFLLKGEARRTYDSLERWGLIILVVFISTNLGNEIVHGGVALFARLLGLDDLIA